MRTLTLVLTDVQGSTRLWNEEPDAMDAAMRRHHEIVHSAVAAHGGFRPPDQGEGDAVFAAFPSSLDAVSAVADMQRRLHEEPWPTTRPIQVRVGVHVGEVRERDGNLFGDPVNRCARIRGLAAGGQTLLSAAVHELVRDRLPAGARVQDLGEHRMKDLIRAERIYQLDIAGLPASFPPLPSLDLARHNLPIQPSPFIGRGRELAEVSALVRAHRLVTVTGFGGTGKTRLALQVAAELASDRAFDDVWFVDLTAETEPSQVPARIADAAHVSYEADALDALVAAYCAGSVLLVVDNLEHLLGAADSIADLLARTTGAHVLATSREPLRVRAERVVALDSLTSPDAVQLFVDRACAVKSDFALTPTNTAAVAAICTRLEGHPLALELAASRLRMLSVDMLLARLDQAFGALGMLTGGSRDMPDRHQTLRATIAWSADALNPEQRSLLGRLSVLPAPADLAMIDAVCGTDLDAFPALEMLVDRSLVRVVGPVELGTELRYGLHVAVQEYAAELLSDSDTDAVRDRHADYVTEVVRGAPFTESARTRVVAELLPHVRAALEHRKRSPDQRYVDLVVALDETLRHRGLTVESLAALDLALSVAVRQRDTAWLLLIRVGSVQLSDAQKESRVALDAAVATGDPDVIAWAASTAAAFDPPDSPELERHLAIYDEVRGRVDEATRIETEVDLVNSLGVSLRFADPARVETMLRRQLTTRPHDGVLRVRLARVLLDHGRVQEAQGVLAQTDPPYRFNDIVMFEILGDVELARLALELGDLEKARTLASAAFDRFLEMGEFPLHPGHVLCDVERSCDNPQAVIDIVNRACTVSDAASAEWLIWRRGRALLELGDVQAARNDLIGARDKLAADPSQGPREWLGCLAALALLIHRDDPAGARALLDTIAERRGGWVLPHLADRDVRTVQGALASR